VTAVTPHSVSDGPDDFGEMEEFDAAPRPDSSRAQPSPTAERHGRGGSRATVVIARSPWRRRLRAGSLALLFVALFTTPVWGPRALARLAFFRVRRVEFVGAQYLAPGTLLARLRVDTTHSVWDPRDPLAARLEGHPQLERVTVGRRLPGTLVVTVVERPPVALVPTPRGFRVFDARGVPLPIDPARTPVDAPVLAARDTALLRILGALRARAPRLYARVSDARRDGRHDLLFHLASLPVRTASDVTVDRFAELESVERDLARRQRRAAEIDLRYRDQVIARIP